MIKDGFNGLIVKRNETDIYNAVKRLVSDEDLRKKLGNEPTLGNMSNETIIQEFESLFVR